jgi:hypothetical protein
MRLRTHLVLLQELRDQLAQERDRRYAEVNVEKEKALKIKETADLAALQLAREIQTYKDEKANELRSQIERERGTYATQSDLRAVTEKTEALIKPLTDYVSKHQGKETGVASLVQTAITIVAVVTAIVALVTR